MIQKPKILILTLVLFLGTSSLLSQDWTELFDGKTLDGWTKRGGEAIFRAEDGAIIGTNGPGPNTFLCPPKEYSDFELEFEVYLSNPLNSGVQIRSAAREDNSKTGKTQVVTGPQIEIEQTPGEAGYVYGEKMGGGWRTPKVDLIAHSTFKNADWNHYRIVAKGPRIQTYINGHQISDLWDEPLYAKHASGFIGFQVHSTKSESGTLHVKWKNIRIREIETDGWTSLFNGKDLTGWSPKITGYKYGENPKNIFRVENGVIQATHRDYGEFDKAFGHLFYETPFKSYKIRLEYRFIGDADGQASGGPKWAYRNSGIMIHGQAPETMEINQDFPDSIEVQLLGAHDENPTRSTANICTPGTMYYMDGQLKKKHCASSSSLGYTGDQWVQAEVQVFGSEEIIHLINGNEVLRYQLPQKDDGTLLDGGTISLQAESHNTEFRNIEILVLE